MSVLTMPIMTSSQYLQVPKLPPQRKPRSRSKSRLRDAGTTEVIPVKLRSSTPPMPAAELRARPVASNIPIKDAKMANGITAHIPTSGHAPITSPPPPIQTIPDLPTPTGTNYDDLNEDMYTLDQCRTPPPALPLRQLLVGTWKLESYIAYATPASPIQRPTHPMTKNVTGFIMYTPDGYMSAQMLIPGQQSFKRGEGEEPQWAEAGKRFFAYSGPYYISDEGPGREEVLRHTFQVCNLPGWIGDIQIRTHYFEEDGTVLVLGSQEPTEIKGDKRIPVLKWRRMRDNADGVPPPPTPQIKISGPGEP